MRILIVGACSNPGRHFRRRLKGERWTESVALTRTPGEQMHDRERLMVVEDYFSPPPQVFEGIDTVVNFTGVVKGQTELLHAVNMEGAAKLATLAKMYGARHFVQISSLSVYGQAETIDGSTPEVPISAYGRSKLLGDIALGKLTDDDFMTTLLRCPTFYGPSTASKLELLARAMRRLSWFPAPPVLSERSVLHLDNLAETLVAVVRDRLGGIRFAADPDLFTLESLAKACRIHASHSVTLVRLPSPAFLPLQLVARSSYQSIFGRSVICAPMAIDSARPLIETLGDLFRD